MATHSTVLDQAEARIVGATTTAHASRQGEIEAMRAEIGPENRALAPVKLAELEQFVAKEIRPFVAQLRTIEQRAKQLLPQQIQNYLKEIDTLINVVPTTVRNGVTAFDTLTPPIWPMDGKSIDHTARAQTSHQIRSSLRNWDGVRGRLSDLKRYIENYVRESNWPSMQPGSIQVEQ